MPPRMLPAAGPALHEVGGIDEARMERHQPIEKLPDGRQIPVFRAEVRKPLIEECAIGLETAPIEPTQRWVPPLLQPGEEEPPSFEIGAGRGRGRFPLRELAQELVEIDTEPNERRG